MLKNNHLKSKKYKSILFFLVITSALLFFWLCNLSKINLRPNILILTMDALRPDHLGCYGYKRNTSPEIDRLAKEGIIFTEVVSQAPSTLSSITSFLTSTYPDVSKVYGFEEPFPSGLANLPQMLKKYGYTTTCVTSSPAFDIIDLYKEFDYFYAFETYHGFGTKPKKILEITDRVNYLIKKNKYKKFFLWVHFLEPHQPPFRSLLPGQNIFLNDKYYNSRPQYTEDFPDFNYNIAYYDNAIRYIDTQIGLIMGQLKELSLDRKTLIIISADHGEELGEHGLYFAHGKNLYDTAIKVPLVIKYDKIFCEGKKIFNQVELIDIAPTILDLLGIKKPSTMEGRSLLHIIKKKDFPEKYAFSFLKTQYSLRTSCWKLIYDKEKYLYELYNLRNDSEERYNLYPHLSQYNHIFNQLNEELNGRIRNNKDTGEIKVKLLDDEDKIKLRDLGYIQ